MIEKIVDAKAKTSLQLLFETKKINFRYIKNNWALAKKDKNKANQEHKDSNKDIPHNPLFLNSQLQN